MNLFKKNKIEYFTSIDNLPIDNWFALQKSNDVVFLLKRSKVINDLERKELTKAFDLIWREFIDTFGVSDIMRSIMELRRDILVETCDMYLNNDRSRLTFINLKKRELENIFKDQGEKQYDNTKGYVEKYLGFRLNGKEVTVREYYGYIKMMETHISQTKQQLADVG